MVAVGSTLPLLSLARFLQVRLGRMGGRVRKRHRRRPGQTTDAQTHRRTDAQTHRHTDRQEPVLPQSFLSSTCLECVTTCGCQQEEEKAARKIAQTRERAAKILQLREENEKRMAARAADEVRCAACYVRWQSASLRPPYSAPFTPLHPCRRNPHFHSKCPGNRRSAFCGNGVCVCLR